MSKISNKQLQEMISNGIISNEQGEQMISQGIASGFSRGKVEICKGVGNFREIIASLNTYFIRNKNAINEEMRKNGLPPVKKMSINIAK